MNIHRSVCNQANLKKKQKSVNKNRTTNHYPCKIKVCPTHTRTYSGIILEITPIVDKLGKNFREFTPSYI